MTNALAHRNTTSQYSDVIMGAMASQITSLTIVYSTVYSGADQRKHQSSASLAFVRGIHRWAMNYPHKGPVTRKIFQFDDVIMSKIQRFKYIYSSKLHDFNMDWYTGIGYEQLSNFIHVSL